MEELEKLTQELEKKAEEEANLLKIAVKQGRHGGDGPEDVAEVQQDGK